MQADTETVYRWVEWLKSGTGEQQYQSAMALRALAGDAGNKHLIREAGGIEALLRLLDSGLDSILTVVGAETLSCFAADDPANRVCCLACLTMMPPQLDSHMQPVCSLNLPICQLAA